MRSPSWCISVLSRALPPATRPPYIRVVGDDRQIAQQGIPRENGLEQEDVGEVAGTLVGVVVDKYIAGLDVVPVDLQHPPRGPA